MPKGKTLLGDDEDVFIESLSERMKARGLKIETAHSGEEALEKVRCSRFDAIILDFVMPGMDGIETLRRIKKLNPEQQVMLLSPIHESLQLGFSL